MSKKLRVLLVLIVMTVAASAITLGRWQLRRLGEKKALNALAVSAALLPPDTLDGLRPQPGTVAGRRIVAKGVFDATRQILIRGRVQDQAPGLIVVTPLRLALGDQVLWVLRGFVRSPDAATPPEIIPAPDTGIVEVDGIAVEVTTKSDSGKPLLRGSVTTWARLDQRAMQSLTPAALPFALQLAGDSAGVGHLETLPTPEPTNGPHLSYAIQWFGIALAAIVFGIIFLRQGGPGFVQPPGAP